MNLNELNSSQRKAVTFDGKHLLVLAGAGTGKTKTIIARAAYLISEGVRPDKIQILTFTKRAAAEIVSRVKSNLEVNQATSLNGSTFHSWCNQLLTKFPNLFGTKSFTVIDQDDQLSIMKMVCGKNYIEYKDLRIKAQQLIDLFSFARNTKRNLTETIRLKLFGNLTDESTNLSIQEIKPSIETILRGYQAKKIKHKYLDYDDMLQVVAGRLQKDKQAKNIVGSLFEHILVDEMQDTNPLQWELLSPFQEMSHLFCVGDDAQSIYSFRGADFKNVHSFKERVADSEVYVLQDNYRSTQEVLDVSNWLLEKSPIEYNKKLISVRGKGSYPTIINVQNEWEEANWIADKIIENFTSKDKTYSDHLVLSRSQYYTKALQAVFIQNKIPYVTFGGRKFMESAHIKDLIAAMRVVNNIDDEIAWIRFLTLWEGIGEIKGARYIQEMSNLDTIEECIERLSSIVIDGAGSIISEVLTAISNHRDDLSLSVQRAFELMEKRLSKKYIQDWENKRRPDFPVLTILAESYSTLGEFIAECTLDNATKINNSPTLQGSLIKKSEAKDHVIISTIHSAKGLESDICFVLNVSPKAYPSSWSIGNENEVEEERRVLYVALTRAKNELIITRNVNSLYAESKDIDALPEKNNSSNRKSVDSYFLNGLPDNLVVQETIGRTKKEVKDIDTPNPLDISLGMDFS